MADMGPINLFLDLKVEQNQEMSTIKLFQPLDYIDKDLSKFHLNQANLSNILMKKLLSYNYKSKAK